MSQTQTLFEIVGASRKTVDWGAASLVLVNFQREFERGKVQLDGEMYTSVSNAEVLLALARSHDIPVFFVVHTSVPAAGIFDRDTDGVKLLANFVPNDDEELIPTNSANAFFRTALDELLSLTNRKQLLIAGFMSHLSVLATAQGANDHGYEGFVFSDACWTRELTAPDGSQLEAEFVHTVSMAAIKDCYASVLNVSDIKDR